MYMAEIHTNNLVKSWHNMLKNDYLKRTRKQRPYMLVCRLINQALRDLKLKVNQKSQYGCISDNLALNLKSRTHSSQEGENDEEVIHVKSITKDSVNYTVSRDDEGQIINCECPYEIKNSSICKHMFILLPEYLAIPSDMRRED